MLTVVNTGKTSQLDVIRTNLLQGATMHLFTNDKTPAAGDTPSDYTEPVFSGYAPITLSAWGAPYINGDTDAQIDEILRTFTMNGGSPENVYGYFITTPGNVLQWAERRAAGPVQMANPGDEYSVVPQYTLGS